MNNITQLPLTYFDSISFESNGLNSQIQMSNAEHQLVIILKNILLLNISQDYLTSDEDYIDAIAITHEYRQVREADLQKYEWPFDKILSPLHIISIYGNTAVEVICETVELKENDARQGVLIDKKQEN